jgi:hypothetical protein
MKKLVAMMIGVGLMMGTVSMFAQDKADTKTEKKTHKSSGKKKGSKKTEETK